MRYAFINTVHALAKRNPAIMVLTADIGFTVFEKFRADLPRQFVNVGVAEANMVGIATGLALSGKIPFIYSIAPFVTYRPFEQVRNDIAVHNAHVVIAGTGAGLSYSEAGPSHHAIEDIAVMRAIPNMTVLCPADPAEVVWATKQAVRYKGPVYLRLGKRGEPAVYPANQSFQLGKPVILRQGSRVAIIATGNIVANAAEAVNSLVSQKIKPSLVSLTTLKPIHELSIRHLADSHRYIVTVEEHSVIGGLGSAVSDVLAQMGSRCQVIKLGIPDTFVNFAGSQTYLRKTFGLDPTGIARTVGKLYD